MSLEERSINPWLCARCACGETFRLEVEDTGPGIAAADLGRLFVEFEQLDGGAGKSQPGTGLGLALTKRLVEAQGGSLGVRSTPGVGSVFHAVLPRVHRGALLVVPSPGPSPGAPRRTSGAAVLVVEDDPRDQATLVQALSAAGFAVETAATGAEAVARAHARAFTAITLDLLLPDMSGLEVLAAIRTGERNRDVPIIVVTMTAATAAFGGFAVNDLLPKPIDRHALVDALQRIGLSPARPGSVLVIDDDAGSLRLMAAALKELGYSATCMQSGAAALAELPALRPHVIILDLLMPELDGFTFLHELRRTPGFGQTPVFIWTVKDLSADEYGRVLASAQAVLHKRGGLDTLLVELSALLPASSAVAEG